MASPVLFAQTKSLCYCVCNKFRGVKDVQDNYASPVGVVAAHLGGVRKFVYF